MTRAVLLGLFLSAGAAVVQTAAPPPPDIDAIRTAKRAEVVRITEPIRVDGVLDEPAWELAPITTDFYQQQPAEFELATRRTEVRFLYDDEMLYVGAVLYEPEPERLIVNELKRDFSGSSGDGFGLIIDTFQDKRSSYGFLTNPGGAQRESLGYDNGRRNDANWHGVWHVRTTIHREGWTVEYAIPFKTLRFPDRELQEWGMNMIRWARRANETSTWSPVPRQFTHYNVAYAGTLAGISSVQRGRNLQVKPFATSEVERGGLARPLGWDGQADGGIDMKWGVTSSLLLDATWRTDFSQVEADEQQINLTRFSLFFPEKREFFLESPSAFQIGLVEGNNETPRRELVPFFSRRIGLSSRGQPIPVVGGLRLTGRAGRHSIGVMNMQTEDFEGDPGDNFTAVRIARDVSTTSSLGAFYFGRESGGADPFNRVGGLDFRMRPNRTVEIEAFGMRSSTAHVEEGVSRAESSGWAGRGGLRVDARAHRVRAGYVHVDSTFQHDIGYVRRRGVGTWFGNYARVIRPANQRGRVREYTVGVEAEDAMDDRWNESLTRIAGVSYGMLFADGAELRAWTNRTRDQIDTPFEISGDLEVGAGVYTYDGGGIRFESNQSAAFSGSIEVSGGEFWDGRQKAAASSLRYRFSAHLAASASLSRSVVDLPTGSFTGDLVGLRLDWSLTPRMFLNAFVQYNGEADTWLSNVRFNVIHRPLSDVYVVWNETRLPTGTRRAVLLKYTHLLAF
jgi:hypothetical protein